MRWLDSSIDVSTIPEEFSRVLATFTSETVSLFDLIPLIKEKIFPEMKDSLQLKITPEALIMLLA